jgi:hypothetical protein
MICNGAKDAVECSQPQRIVAGNRDSLRERLVRLQDNVTAGLMNLDVAQLFAKHQG